MKQKGQIVEILPTSPIYSSDLSSSLSTETDFLSASQKRQYSLFDGILVGEHDGWSNFRLGQRKGINVGGKKKPLYVIGINKKENRVFVGEGIDHPGLLTKVIAIEKNENIEEQNKNSVNQASENKSNYREKLKHSYGLKKYRIQEVIKPGQVILIQVLKEERGQKGAALTSFISLAGKYMVLMPNTAKGGGISRKIFNSTDRQKIREILNKIEIPRSMGVIVRTAGANKTKNEIEKDFQNTLKTWEEIKEKAVVSNAPSLIYEEGDIIKRALRDIYDNDTKSVSYTHLTLPTTPYV